MYGALFSYLRTAEKVFLQNICKTESASKMVGQFAKFVEKTEISKVFLELILSESEIVPRFFLKKHPRRKWQFKLHTHPSFVRQNTYVDLIKTLFCKFCIYCSL